MYGGRSGNRGGGCFGCCLNICPCFSGCPCCKGGDQGAGNIYSSQTDLKKILVQSKNVEDFDLKIMDMEDDQATKKKISQNTTPEKEPIVIINNVSKEVDTPITTVKQPTFEIIDGFSDDEQGPDQVIYFSDISSRPFCSLYRSSIS